MSEQKVWILGIVIVVLITVFVYPRLQNDLGGLLDQSSNLIDGLINGTIINTELLNFK